VTACGLTQSPELHITVYPFILRGVTLQGVDSAETPMSLRLQMWQRLAGEWKPSADGERINGSAANASQSALENIAQVVTLEQLDPMIDAILQGKLRGRVVIDLTPDS
jgi:hypothetical protein